ncbi:MAG: hypothetical protein R3D44_02175 [Hyphomicrobiaceae bacterium]
MAVVSALVGAPTHAQNVPFATPPPYKAASLGDIMGTIQTRHIKLWMAIEKGNWPLVGYEVGQMRGSLVRAATLYLKIPIELIEAGHQPLAAIEEAAKAKALDKSKQGYDKLTAACNACHEAAQIGFIRIQTPTSAPFGDQKF